jgi:hypothetical protein
VRGRLPTTLREKLTKNGAKVVRHGRCVVFQLAEVAVPPALFAEILRRIDQMRPRPPLLSASAPKAMNDGNPTGEVRPMSDRDPPNAIEMRGAGPRRRSCASTRHVRALAALPPTLKQHTVGPR